MEQELERARQELFILHEVSNAIHSALRMDTLLRVTLAAAVSRAGLGFDRAMLFLVNERLNAVAGKMVIESRKGADRIWTRRPRDRKNFTEFLSSSNDKFSQKFSSPINRAVRKLRIPLSEDAGIIPMAILEQMPFEITTDNARRKIKDKVINKLELGYFVVVPLRGKNKSIGVIIADNAYTRKPILKKDTKILTMIADQAGLAIENSRLYEKMFILSQQNSLTGLWNHGHFQYLLSAAIKKANKKKEALALIMLDIDYFKNYNDALGHQAGDKALKKIAEITKRNVRKKDIAARYGGEEFSIILPATDRDLAYKVAERLRAAVAAARFLREEIQPGGKFTISVGTAVSSGEEPIDKNRLIYAADKALYRAKKEGKNKTCIAPPSHTTKNFFAANKSGASGKDKI